MPLIGSYFDKRMMCLYAKYEQRKNTTLDSIVFRYLIEASLLIFQSDLAPNVSLWR